MEHTICNLQHIKKTKPPLNIKLNNHKKEIKDPKVILADKHFQKCGHRFSKHTRFTVFGRLKKYKLRQRNLKRTCYSKRLLFYPYENCKVLILKD